ncbi:MAG TPA: hypothetical protein VHR66_03605 [Gemmataceae bacterium]|nr:hypothetical protein [Gemmataceae bacterium]
MDDPEADGIVAGNGFAKFVYIVGVSEPDFEILVAISHLSSRLYD